MANQKRESQSGDADANRAIRHGRAVDVRKKIAAEISRSQAVAEDIAELCNKASRISQELPPSKPTSETESDEETRT